MGKSGTKKSFGQKKGQKKVLVKKRDKKSFGQKLLHKPRRRTPRAPYRGIAGSVGRGRRGGVGGVRRGAKEIIITGQGVGGINSFGKFCFTQAHKNGKHLPF